MAGESTCLAQKTGRCRCTCSIPESLGLYAEIQIIFETVYGVEKAEKGF